MQIGNALITLLSASELTISSDAITVTQANHKLQPESGTSDNLSTINGTSAGQFGVLYCTDFGTDTITIKHNVGNILCINGNDITLSNGCVFWYSNGTKVFISGGGASVANLTGTQEKLSDAAVVGVATTAARSDHKHSVGLSQGFLFGLTLSNNGSDATNDIDIAAGKCRDSTDAVDMVLSSALTGKQLDAAWAVGSAAGGLDQGSIANATYHVHLIKRSDTGVVDAIYSLSHDKPATVTMTIASPAVVTWGVAGAGHGLVAGSPFKFSTTGALPTGVTAGTQYYVISAGLTETAFQFSTSNGGAAVNTSGTQSGVHTGIPGPKMPTSYDSFRRIGSIIRSGATILAFSQVGDEFLLKTSVLDYNAASIPNTNAQTLTLTVPAGVKVAAYLGMRLVWASGGVCTGTINSLDENDQAYILGIGISVSSSLTIASGRYKIRTNTSSQIRGRFNTTTANYDISTSGWIDTRGMLV